MNTTTEKLVLALAKLLGWIALTAASSVWRGYVLSILWGWFIVRAFGLPALNIPLAIGLSLTVGFLTQRLRQEKESTHFVIGVATLAPAVSLFMGWIVTKFL